MKAATVILALVAGACGPSPRMPKPLRHTVHLALTVDAAARADSAMVYDALRDALNAEPTIRVVPFTPGAGGRHESAEYLLTCRLADERDSLSLVVRLIDVETTHVGPTRLVRFTRAGLRDAVARAAHGTVIDR